jgi:hypothetical protein
MPYTGPDGTTHDASYWNVAGVNLDKTSKTGLVVFNGYHDADARQSGKALIGQKTYPVSPETFDAYFSVQATDAKGKNVFKQAYELADATPESTGPFQQDKKDAGVPFFSQATDL